MGRRILLLNTDLLVGGTPAVVRELAWRLHAPAEGVEVEVACLSAWGAVADEITAKGVPVTALGADDVFDLPGVVGRLIRLIQSRRIDTVFSFLVHANTVAAVASRFCREVRFFQSIQTTQARPRWHWRVQGWVSESAERIVVPSESVAEAAMARSGISREKIVVIPNAVECSTGGSPEILLPHQRDAGATSINHGRAARATLFNVAFIGRLDPVKRIPDLIRAVHRLGREDVQLNIYGEGEERSMLLNLIDELKLQKQVTLHGIFPSAEALADSDLLVLPSEAEGFGLVLIEAMAAGVAVVATDAPGIRDVVIDNVNGLLVSVGDVDALAKTIGRCADDDQLRARLIARGGDEVRNKYTWDRVLPQYQRLLGLPA